MCLKNFHPGKLAFYVALSFCDLFLTYQLLGQSGGRVYESNPIANAWLLSFGWRGLFAFKMVAMLLVSGVSIYISLYHPRKGGFLLKLACVIVGAVVIYSCSLMRSYANQPSELADKALLLDEEMAVHRQFDDVMNQVRGDLASGRCTLTEAVHRLKQTAKAKDPTYRAALRKRYPSLPEDERLMAYLMDHLMNSSDYDQSTKERIANKLFTESVGTSSSAASSPADDTLVLSRSK